MSSSTRSPTPTSIGDAAFASCTSLTTVTFPAESKLAVIGNYAFSCCGSLTKLAFPDGLIAVGKYAPMLAMAMLTIWPYLETMTCAHRLCLHTLHGYT